jgi:hypothetical protein
MNSSVLAFSHMVYEILFPIRLIPCYDDRTFLMAKAYNQLQSRPANLFLAAVHHDDPRFA